MQETLQHFILITFVRCKVNKITLNTKTVNFFNFIYLHTLNIAKMRQVASTFFKNFQEWHPGPLFALLRTIE